MPTKKPRFLVTIEPDHHRALKALAAISGKSVSGLINAMLEPQLRPFLNMVHSIERDPRQADLIEALETSARSMDDFMNAVGGMMGLPPLVTSDQPPKRPAEAPSARGGKEASGRASILRSGAPDASPAHPEAELTPLTNRGVTLAPGRAKPRKSAISPRGRKP